MALDFLAGCAGGKDTRGAPRRRAPESAGWQPGARDARPARPSGLLSGRGFLVCKTGRTTLWSHGALWAWADRRPEGAERAVCEGKCLLSPSGHVWTAGVGPRGSTVAWRRRGTDCQEGAGCPCSLLALGPKRLSLTTYPPPSHPERGSLPGPEKF